MTKQNHLNQAKTHLYIQKGSVICNNSKSLLLYGIILEGWLKKQRADGVVISSPTGSTAYSLSIGAPVVMPEANVFIIAPIAPHNLNVRPLIIPDTSVVEISYKSRQGDAIITLDNRFFSCGEHKKIVIKKAKHKLKSVSINNNFIAVLNQKLLCGEVKSNNF